MRRCGLDFLMADTRRGASDIFVVCLSCDRSVGLDLAYVRTYTVALMDRPSLLAYVRTYTRSFLMLTSITHRDRILAIKLDSQLGKSYRTRIHTDTTLPSIFSINLKHGTVTTQLRPLLFILLCIGEYQHIFIFNIEHGTWNTGKMVVIRYDPNYRRPRSPPWERMSAQGGTWNVEHLAERAERALYILSAGPRWNMERGTIGYQTLRFSHKGIQHTY